MKIKIGSLDSLSFTKNEENFVRLLETDKFFEDYIIEVRKLLGIPEDPLNSKNKSKFNIEKKATLDMAASILVNVYENLPFYWTETFELIIITGIAYPPISKNFETIHLESIKHGDTQKTEVTIVIKSQTNLTQIKKYLQQHKSYLDMLLKTLPKEPGNRMKDPDIKKVMYKIRQSGKKHKDVGDEMNKKYEQLSFQTDYSTISSEYGRFRGYLDTVLKKNPKYQEFVFKMLQELHKIN